MKNMPFSAFDSCGKPTRAAYDSSQSPVAPRSELDYRHTSRSSIGVQCPGNMHGLTYCQTCGELVDRVPGHFLRIHTQRVNIPAAMVPAM